MNKNDLEFYKELIDDLFNDKNRELENEVNKLIDQKMKQALSENESMISLLNTLDNLNSKISTLDNERTKVKQLITEYSVNIRRNFTAGSVYNNYHNTQSEYLCSIKDSISKYIKDNLKGTNIGDEMDKIREEKRNAMLSIRLITTPAEIKDFLVGLYTKFGKTLPL
jgi:hypothetical protein